MNGSHAMKFIWWGTAGCGSRSTQVFLTQAGCDDLKNYNEGYKIPSEGSHTHAQGIPEGMEDYPIICNVRNPYSKCVSSFLDETSDKHHRNYGMEFKEWILELTSEDRLRFDYDHYYISEWEKIGRRPNYLIRLEHMGEDLRKLPMYQHNERFENAMTSVRVNSYMNENPRDEYVGNFQKFQKYYTQEIADIVYNNHKEYFELGGYDKDSWKL
jgi:hypothetical protein